MWSMTQKCLGTLVGFSDKSSDVRLAHYETGSHKPKADLTVALAQVLDISLQALDVPDIDRYIGLMHTLFSCKNIYALTVREADVEISLKVNKDKNREANELLKYSMLGKNGQINPLPMKSVRKNMTVGVITIQSSTPHASERKFPLRN